jgi:heptosyltransferase-1
MRKLTLRSLSNLRVLIVRLGAMGDILHALPAVTALRAVHPGWQIGWVVEPRWRALLAAESGRQGTGVGNARRMTQPLVDRIHFAAVKEWARRPLSPRTMREILALRKELRAEAYDVVIDFQGAVRSAAIARMAGARRVIGEAIPREKAARWFFSECVRTRGMHVIDQDVEVAATVCGETLEPAQPLLPVDADAESWCDALLAPAGGRPVALLTPGAGWGAKRWPVDRYAAVACGLIERGMHVLVNSGPGEEALAAAIHSATSGAAVPVSATLGQLVALTRRIALCIAGDTGPLHLACALGRPVVGIYGPTDPGRNGPYGTHFAVLRSAFSRRDHTRRATPELGLLTILPDEVLRAADDLLAGEPARRAL